MGLVLGYVDSVDDVAVHGWIANLERPGEQEPIVCSGPDGARALFMPFLPRLDVCQALSQPGRFGFAIPTRLLRPLGPVVTVADRDGTPLSGGEAVLLPENARPARPDGQCWVFLHIQKTAGTSVRSAIAAEFLPGEVAFVYPDPFIGLSPQEFGELPEQQRAALRLVVGHVYFGIDERLPHPADYVTVIREPGARLRSHYYHHVGAGTAFTLSGMPIPTSRVVQHGLIDEFDNLMTRMISGQGWEQASSGAVGEVQVECALQNLKERFRFVALAENLDEEFGAMCEIMGLGSVPLAVENVRRVQDTASLDTAVDWAEALHRNRFDVMLYERILAEGLHGRDLRPRAGRVAREAA